MPDNTPPIEGMSDFFKARLDIYDEHMLEFWADTYRFFGGLVPGSTKSLLDIGCGTGLELGPIFARLPALHVTGVDMTSEMLSELRRKYDGHDITLICGDYFTVPLGGPYDCAVSFETLHHFTREKKQSLYRRLYSALRRGGRYIECDYMASDDESEAREFAVCARLRAEAGIPEDVYVHYDTPLTEARQTELIRNAGFSSVRRVYRNGNTVILSAMK